MEFKSYENDYTSNLGDVVMKGELEEEIPIVNIKELKPPPKPTPVLVEQIKVVEDQLEIEESIVESTETDESEAVVAVITSDDIIEAEETEEIIEDIPFMMIQDVPVFPGCKGNNKELKDCFSQKTKEHFAKYFNPNLASELGLTPGKKKLFVVFRIDKNGNINNIRARGPHPLLEKEIIKIVGSLPQMKPGKQRGRPVPVSYSIPITFEVIL